MSEPIEMAFGIVVILAAIGAVGFVVTLLWGAARMAAVVAQIALIHGIGILGILLQGYMGGGVGRMIALSLLTIALIPLGLIAAFLCGAHDLHGTRPRQR